MPTAAAHSAVVGARFNSALSFACVRSNSNKSCACVDISRPPRSPRRQAVASPCACLNLPCELHLLAGGEESHLAHFLHHAQRLLSLLATATRAVSGAAREAAA